jgi:hypothetical protein
MNGVTGLSVAALITLDRGDTRIGTLEVLDGNRCRDAGNDTL